jgi:hypothetical protein
MFDTNLAKQAISKLKAMGFEIAPGLSPEEINEIENAYALNLPDDLKCLLSEGVPIKTHEGELFPDWRGDIKGLIKESNKLIESAFIFDIEENSYWHELFGARPANDKDAVQQALAIVRTWPPLIRIFAHRFMTTDNASNNPVLSVVQATDSVYYGYNLSDYLIREFNIDLPVKVSDTPPRVSKWGEAFDLLNETD